MNGAAIYKGVFWWINGALVCRKVRCSDAGAPLEPVEFTAKSGENFNHKAEWEKLPRSVTGGKPYNYYPRGRVEVKQSKATVYLNPQLNREDVKAQIEKEFGLKGLSCVCAKSDGSAHYRALADEEAEKQNEFTTKKQRRNEK